MVPLKLGMETALFLQYRQRTLGCHAGAPDSTRGGTAVVSVAVHGVKEEGAHLGAPSKCQIQRCITGE